MFGIIIGTHGAFARELVNSCEMICGEQKNVKTVTMDPGESLEDITERYEAAIRELSSADGIIFLNDIFGGSPYNAACRLVLQHEDYGIVTGVSLPMLIDLVTAQLSETPGIQELMDRAVEAGRNGMQSFHASFVADEEKGMHGNP